MTAVEILERRVRDLERQRDDAYQELAEKDEQLRLAVAQAKRIRAAYTAAYSELELARSTAGGK